MIGTNGKRKRELGKSLLPAGLDDDKDDIYVHIFI